MTTYQRILSLVLFSLLIPVMSFAALVGSWDFNEGAGSVVNDSSGFINNGALTNSGVTWAPGIVGSALNFDGQVGSGVIIPNSSSLNLNQTNRFTMMAWVKATNITGGGKVILSKYGNGASFLLKKHNDTDKFRLELFNGVDLSSNTSVVLNTWIHVAVTYDGSVFQFYYNGQPDGFVNFSGNVGTSADNVNIGCTLNGAAENWDGVIDSVRIYNHALTQQEIQSAMMGPYFMKYSFTQNNTSSYVVGAEPPTNISFSPVVKVEGPADTNTYTACFAGNLTTPYQFNGVNVYLSDPTCIGSDSLATGSATFTNFVCPASGCIDPALQCVTYQLGNNGIENMQSLGVVHVTVGQ